VRGLNLGVDFVGGLMIEAKFASKPPLEQGTRAMSTGSASVTRRSSSSVIPTPCPCVCHYAQQGGEGASNAVVAKVKTVLEKNYPGISFTRVDTVSGKVSGELKSRTGTLAVLLAVLGIAIFSWFRYEWQFGVSTFVAIMHDVLMTLGFFAVTQLEFDLNIVAAVLTIVGYSINDKMVIDDRIRENMRKYRKMDMKALIDLSVNETLPRTVMTSLTVMLALGALLIFGGHVLMRLHRGDAARHRRRHLFLDLCVVVAADLFGPDA
jgi:preprotein translocase subunit SecF